MKSRAGSGRPRQRPRRRQRDSPSLRFRDAAARQVFDSLYLLLILAIGIGLDWMLNYVLPDGIAIIEELRTGIRIVGGFGVLVLYLINTVKSIVAYYHYRD